MKRRKTTIMKPTKTVSQRLSENRTKANRAPPSTAQS
jgi:hypothetical protein